MTEFFTVGWTAPATVGLQPIHAGMEEQAFFTVGWTAKRSATYYPYDASVLAVPPGAGPDGTVLPPSWTGDSGSSGDAATSGSDASGSADAGSDARPNPPAPSPVVRPHAAKLYVVQRRDPGAFRKAGLALKVQVDAAAEVDVSFVAFGHRRIAYGKSRKLKAGTTRISLRASDYGKATSRVHRAIHGTLKVAITFADGQKATLTRTVLLEAAKAKKG
jgi:hypothetical protein